MKRIFNKVMFYFGVILFCVGVCCANSEYLLIPIAMTFGGLGIAYLNRSVYYEYYRKYDKKF
mgnify:CR=1 FL=1